MNLKLKEVIWEITNKCSKNCDYCGSKDILNTSITSFDSKELVFKILKNLIDYQVPEVNISGGEPGDMDRELLEYVIEELKANNITVKIITNGDIFHKDINLNIVDGFGLSINSLKDVEYFKEYLYPKLVELRLLSKTTILTNFGSYNIWDFDEILNLVKNNNLHWQIQLTMGDYQLNENGIEYLYSKIYSMNYKNYILADNLQKEHNCTAGLNTCGIIYDGFVVPCLSMRSYDSNIKDYMSYEYDLKGSSLKEIWENSFKELRFNGKFKCCRDCINYPKEEKSKLLEAEEVIRDIIKPYEPIISKPKIPNDSIVMMYGVHLNEQINYNNIDK